MSDNSDDSTKQLVDFFSALSLSPKEERPKILKSIIPVLSKVEEKKSWKQYLSSGTADINLIFSCFDSVEEEEDINAISEVLQKVAVAVKGKLFLERYAAVMQKGLSHKNDLIKIANLKVLQKTIRYPESANLLSQNDELLSKVLDCMQNSELSVAKDAMNVFEMLENEKQKSGNNDPSPLLTSNKLRQQLKDIAKDNNETLVLRAFEVLIKISKDKPKNFQLCIRHNFFLSLCQLMSAHKHDVLLQLNALELISVVAETETGIKYLESIHFLNDLDAIIGSQEDDDAATFSKFLLHGLVKLFAIIAYHEEGTSTLYKYKNVKKVLLRMLQNSNNADNSDTILALRTYALICRRPEKKVEMLKDEETFQAVLKQVKKYVNYGSTDEKLCALNAISEIVGVSNPEMSSEDELKVNESFFNGFVDNPLDKLVTISKQPLLDAAEEAHVIFLKLSLQTWALEQFQSQPGFIEFLLDRRSTPNKAIAEHKFQILKNIIEHPQSDRIFNREVIQAMKENVKKGLFYSDVAPQVATSEM